MAYTKLGSLAFLVVLGLSVTTSHARSVDETSSAPPLNSNTEVARSSRVVDLASLGYEMTDSVDIGMLLLRNVLGMPRNEPTRVTRQILGAVAGRNECWNRMLCQAGRMLASFQESATVFRFVERFAPTYLGDAVKIMRSSAVDGNDCTAYLCDA